jgi:hypothetical protein
LRRFSSGTSSRSECIRLMIVNNAALSVSVICEVL